MKQSLCLFEPEGEVCAALRADGWLPPRPPPIGELLRCWRVRELRDDLPASWWCFGERDVAMLSHGRWDVWKHGGWRRDDRPSHAGWTAETHGIPTLWLTVLPGAPVSLHVSDGRGLVSAMLVHDAQAGERDDRRRALPTIDEVCTAARACLVALEPPPPPRAPGDDSEIMPSEDPLAGTPTLATCQQIWSMAADRLRSTTTPVPAHCGQVSAGDTSGWDSRRIITPPFAPIEDR